MCTVKVISYKYKYSSWNNLPVKSLTQKWHIPLSFSLLEQLTCKITSVRLFIRPMSSAHHPQPLPARHAHASCGLANGGKKKKKSCSTFSRHHILFMIIYGNSVSTCFNEFPDLEACFPLSPFQPVWLSAHLRIQEVERPTQADSIFKKRSMNCMNTMLPLPLKKLHVHTGSMLL